MKARILVFLAALWLLTTGLVDLDWMIVAPRFNSWYFTVDYWEFCPYLRLNWWLAYMATLLRIVVGAFTLGWILKTTMEVQK